MKPIPILGIPFYNGVELLVRCIKSVDYPVQKFVLVINNEDVSRQNILDHIAPIVPNEFIAEISIHRHPNIGVAGAWNEVIKCHVAPWWMLVNHDIEFSPGALANFANSMHGDKADIAADYEHNMACFAIAESAILSVGLFDENFWPAYCEDTDYVRRAMLAGVRYNYIGGTKIKHDRSSTAAHMSEAERDWLNRCHDMNKAYFRLKWGGWGGLAQFKRPFNYSDWKLADWIYSPTMRNQRHGIA